MQTPVWVPLLTAALGIVGVLWTQWRADTRADRVWKREREHEARLWAREDKARTFEQRRQNYADFYAALKTMVEGASERAHEISPGPLPPAFGEAAGTQLQLMELYGSGAVLAAARLAFDLAAALGRDSHDLGWDPEAMESEYDQAEGALLNAIRMDLGVPGNLVAVSSEEPDRRIMAT